MIRRIPLEIMLTAFLLSSSQGLIVWAAPSEAGWSPVSQSAGGAPSKTDVPVPVPAPSEKAIRYYRSGNILWGVDLLWALAVPALFLFTGFSARIQTWARKVGRNWFWMIAVYLVVFMILNFVLSLPLSYYEGFLRQHAYGLSTQTFAKWLGDLIKSLAVGLAAGVLVLWILYLLLKRSPRRWWLYAGLLSLPLMMLSMLVAPIWIDPLFNHFGPMKDKVLEAKILALADRAGIEGSRVYEVDKSVDTTAVNAYVTGFLQTKRIVLWDTIIRKLNDRELLVVVGHEMGHYVLGHVVTGMILSFFLTIAMLYLVHRWAGPLIHRYRDRFGFDRLSDIASLPLLLLLVQILAFAASPVALAVSRHQEHEADRFALEITRDNHDAATAFIKLQEENLSVPRPGLLYEIFRASHPSIGERIDFCNEYHPWTNGEPIKYAHLFRNDPQSSK